MKYVGIKNSALKTKILEAAPKIGKKKVLKLPCLCSDDCNRHFEILRMFDKGVKDFNCSEYYKFNIGNGKDHKTIIRKITKFRRLYRSIKNKGYSTKKSFIVVSNNGVRLDGSHRASIIEHLKYDKIKVIVVRWEDMFSKRKLGYMYKHIRNQQKKYNSL